MPNFSQELALAVPLMSLIQIHSECPVVSSHTSPTLAEVKALISASVVFVPLKVRKLPSYSKRKLA
jgi:hypothetical protein